MYKRLMGMVRDAWYLAIVVVVSGAVIWFVLAPLAGIAVVFFGFLTFAYFGFMRYDNDGNERADAG